MQFLTPKLQHEHELFYIEKKTAPSSKCDLTNARQIFEAPLKSDLDARQTQFRTSDNFVSLHFKS